MNAFSEMSDATLVQYLDAALLTLWWEGEEGEPALMCASVDIADRVADILDYRAWCTEADRRRRASRWGCTKARLQAGEEERALRGDCFFPRCHQPINPKNLPTGVRRYRGLAGETERA